MASRIKGITIEIGGNTTKLQSALKDTNKTIADTKSELRDVEKLLKLDPSNTELLEQKQKLLKKAVGETADKLETLKDAEKQAQEQFKKGEITEKQYDALKREIVATETSLKDLEKQAKSSNTQVEALFANTQKVSEKAGQIANATKGVSAVGAAVVGGIVTSGIKAASSADELNTLAKQTGLTTDELQKMQYASELVDVSVSDMTGALAKMKKQLGSDGSAKKFAELGVAIRDSNGELRSASDVFYDVLTSLSQIENETERDTKAMDIFGKGADSLAGIIDDGGASLKQYGQEAEDLGLILDEETLSSLNDVNDQMDRLKERAKFTLLKEGAKAAEALTPVLEDLADSLGKIMEWIGSIDADTLKLIATIAGVVAAIAPIAGIIAALANPVGLVVTAIALAVGTIGYLIKGIVDDFKKIPEEAKQTWDTVASFFVDLWNRIKEIAKGIWETMKETFNKVVEWGKEKINWFLGIINLLIGGINKLIAGINKLQFDVPDWVPLIGGMTFGFNIPEIPSIPLLASGGVVMNGNSAIVGDRGAELLTMNNGRAYVQPLSGGTHITQTNNFTNYQPRDGANAARNLNRQLGLAY